jgi:peptidoglycan hydrolase-like protein with peptidoglycan-binding domain
VARLQPRRRRGILAVAALVTATLAVGAVVLLGSGSSARGGGASSAGGVPPGQTTAQVERRTLSESATVDGTLGYGSTLELYDRLSGTFTWLPKVGAVVRRGGTLFRVNEQPVVLMYGSVPAYRALRGGVADGPDVGELNANLIALGFDPYGAIPIAEEKHYGAATTAAVKRWQESLGLKETGEVELGRILFAPGARRVTKLHVSLGQDPPGASEADAGEEPAERPANEKAEEKAAGGKEEAAGGKEEAAAKKPAAKKKPAKERSSPEKAASASPEKAASEEGGGGGAGELVLSTTSTQQIVTLALKAEQQQLARVGERVPVILPGGSVVHGRIAEVGTVASEASSEDEGAGGGGGSGESATVAVTVDLDRRVARLDQAPVSVELVKSVSRHVLVVPATALMAAAGGGYAIDVLEAGRRRQLRVSPGMFANGYVQVEGPGLRVGMEVLEPR